MSGRPEILWPLFGALEALPGIGPKSAESLAGQAIEKPRDLIFTLPQGGVDRRVRDDLNDLAPPLSCSVEVLVQRHHRSSGRGRPHRVACVAGGRDVTVVFFRGRPDWIEKELPIGQSRVLSGKLEAFEGHLQMAHPDYIRAPDDLADMPDFEPIYPLSQGVTQKAMRKAVQAALDLAPQMHEWADPALIAREGWPQWQSALAIAHAPDGPADLGQTPARRRLAYDELFAHQLTLGLARTHRCAGVGRPTMGDGAIRARLLAALDFALTGAQERAVAEISADLSAPQRMSRLLQGDVGAGKTLVALMALAVAAEAGGQGVLMAPTEILARQHMEGLAPLAQAAGLRLMLLTGRDKGTERASKLADLAEGRVDILIGTHAVFQADVEFQDLRLAVIDEQHRFGVAQRMQLGAKGDAVDVLVMTATPIPRSLALAQYGDMDVSILDEKPPGRSPVTTALVSADRLDQVVERLRAAVAEGRQAYWVCPLVEDSEVSDLTSAESRFRSLRAALGEGVVGLVHGQMPPAEKDAVMADFVAGRLAVLVATTVIEVGVNVPNASIMVIERAERFGLAQLHQLRGRVGRGAAQSTCLLLFAEPLSESGRKRLEILRETEDGFRISEEDLAIRGAGDMIGTAQSGLPRFRIADLERDGALMALALQDARLLLDSDPALDGPRGRAARLLLWLLEQDRAIRMIKVG